MLRGMTNETNSPGGKRPRASDIKRQVGERLYAVRWEIDTNRSRLAQRYGQRHTTWEKWEKGETYPDPFVMQQLCADHGITMDYLYRGVLAHMPNEELKLTLARKLPAHLLAGAGIAEPAGIATKAPAASRRPSEDRPAVSGTRRKQGARA